MAWEIEYTDEFSDWFNRISERDQDCVSRTVSLLIEHGTTLSHPHSSKVNSSGHSNMRELRVQSGGRPIRVLYAFDPRRTAILLIGGEKTGNDRFYAEYVLAADRLYDQYLDELSQEGLIP